MRGGTKFLNALNEKPGVLHGRRRQYAVAQVKNVSAAGTDGVEYPFDLPSDLFFGCEQYTRIEISLHDLAACLDSGFADVFGPIDAESVAFESGELCSVVNSL